MTRKLFDRAFKYLDSEVLRMDRADLTIETKTGSILQFLASDCNYSEDSDSLDSLKNVDFDWLVVDNAAFMKESVWDIISKRLSEINLDNCNSKLKNKALLLSVPMYYSWFNELVERSKDEESIKTLRFTTEEGGIVSKDKIEYSRGILTKEGFNSEYLALLSK